LERSRRERRKLEEALKWGRRVPRGFTIEIIWNSETPKKLSLRDLQIPEEGGLRWSNCFNLPRT